jgi:hypothetical protein
MAGSESKVNDPILDRMAEELREALITNGLDPTAPPANSGPPAHRAYGEYVLRGGKVYSDPDKMVKALVEKVKAG